MSTCASTGFAPIDYLRIAVALIALKHKPSEHSITSYMLDLRAKFLPLGPSPPTSDHSWRAHALQMEREFGMLRAEYEAERIKNLAQAPKGTAAEPPTSPLLTTVVPSSHTGLPQPSKHVSETSLGVGNTNGNAKRKPKKKKHANSAPTPSPAARQQREGPMLLEMIMKSDEDFPCREIVGSDTLLSAVDSLHRLTLATGSPSSSSSTLPAHVKENIASATVRTLEILAKDLRDLLNTAKPGHDHNKKLEFFSRVLEAVFSVTLTLPATSGMDLGRCYAASLDGILGLYLKDIAVPCVSAFLSVSEGLIQDLTRPLNPPAGSESAVDIRYGVLSLLRTSFAALFSIIQRPCRGSGTPGVWKLLDSLRMSLVLETLKEMRRMLSGGGSETIRRHNGRCGTDWERLGESGPGLSGGGEVNARPTSDPSSPLCRSVSPTKLRKEDERRVLVRKLAIKDTLWFLCSILHALSAPEFHGAVGESVLLNASSDEEDKHHQTLDIPRQRLRLAIRDSLLDLVVGCQASSQGSNRHGRNASSGANRPKAPTASREEMTDISKTFIGIGVATQTEQKGKEKLEKLEKINMLEGEGDESRPSYSIEEVLVDEAAYGMLLGVVEKFMMSTL